MPLEVVCVYMGKDTERGERNQGVQTATEECTSFIKKHFAVGDTPTND